MSETPDRWKRISSRTIADCRVFTVREDTAQNGSANSTFFGIENPDWVNVIAITPEREVVLIRQFRHGAGDVTTEIPGGMVDAGEEPEAAARRELLEETGFTSEKWVRIGVSDPNPALQQNTMHHFLALDAVKTSEVGFDEHESVVATLVPEADIGKLIASGEIRHSLVIAAFYFHGLIETNG